jgi:transcriptional regulator with XRE-family HTH domain
MARRKPDPLREDPQENVIDAAVIRAATMAAAGLTGARIAAELGVSESTVSRWRQRADFQAIQNAILRETVNSASARLRALTLAAVAVLKDVIVDPRASTSDRIRAAGYVLDKVLGDTAHESNIGPTNEDVLNRRIQDREASQHLDDQFNEMMRGWTQ